MKNTLRFLVPSLLVVGALSLVGCSEAKDEVTNTYNCASVCNRYEDCVDKDFDSSECTDKCEDRADANENQEERLEACDSCIDDKSCKDIATSCATECVDILP
jgi:hypothetical protein